MIKRYKGRVVVPGDVIVTEGANNLVEGQRVIF